MEDYIISWIRYILHIIFVTNATCFYLVLIRPEMQNNLWNSNWINKIVYWILYPTFYIINKYIKNS